MSMEFSAFWCDLGVIAKHLAYKLCPPSHRELAIEVRRAVEALDAIARGTVHQMLRADLHRLGADAKTLLLRVGVAVGGRAGWARRAGKRCGA
jgi:hypothetical protein